MARQPATKLSTRRSQPDERSAPRAPARSSRIAKRQVLDRIARDTETFNGNGFLLSLKRQGYHELPLDEIQDRLSKLRTALAEFIVSRRG
jgi:hypothetical protein